jgi:hypothetical protein
MVQGLSVPSSFIIGLSRRFTVFHDVQVHLLFDWAGQLVETELPTGKVKFKISIQGVY